MLTAPLVARSLYVGQYLLQGSSGQFFVCVMAMRALLKKILSEGKIQRQIV
jgi:hypothetical protein